MRAFSACAEPSAAHQFEKDNFSHGATMIYSLSENHLSIHTFVDEGKITIDLFTCGLDVDDGKLKSIIKRLFYCKRIQYICLLFYTRELNFFIYNNFL